MLTRVWNLDNRQLFGIAFRDRISHRWNSVIMDSNNNRVYSGENAPSRKIVLHRMRAAVSRARTSV